MYPKGTGSRRGCDCHLQTCKGLSQRPQDKSALTVNKTIKTVVVIKETVLTLNWSSIMTLVQVACARGAEMWSRERDRAVFFAQVVDTPAEFGWGPASGRPGPYYLV